MTQRLELVWPGKDKFLLVPRDESGKPVWVEPDHPAAREVRLEALRQAQALGDRQVQIDALLDLANDLLQNDEYAEAEKHLLRAQQLASAAPPLAGDLRARVALTLAGSEVSGEGSGWGAALKEALLGKSIVLLAGGLAIGWIAGPERMELVNPVFVDLFYGALTLFLIDLGVTVAKRARSLRVFGVRLVAMGIVIPLVNGSLGVTFATMSGLSVGGAAVVGVMAASASYIAAPAAVRIALPDANPALYLTAALGITFPFNIIVGIPLFFWVAQAVGG